MNPDLDHTQGVETGGPEQGPGTVMRERTGDLLEVLQAV